MGTSGSSAFAVAADQKGAPRAPFACQTGVSWCPLISVPQPNWCGNRENRMSDCLHCDINELVQQRFESGDTDVVEMASMIVESLADLILLAPKDDQPNLMAHAISAFGQMFLEKSGALEGGSSATH